jgi:hypothetical protein
LPRVPSSTLLGNLRRASEQTTRLLRDLISLMQELEQASALPALTAALHDLRHAVEELATQFGDAHWLAEQFEQGNFLERARAIVEPGENRPNNPQNEEVRILGDLRRLVNRLQEEISDSHQDQAISTGDGKDLVIKTDGVLEGVILGVGVEKNIALSRFRLAPESGGSARVVLGAKNEALQQVLDFLKPAVQSFTPTLKHQKNGS